MGWGGFMPRRGPYGDTGPFIPEPQAPMADPRKMQENTGPIGQPVPLDRQRPPEQRHEPPTKSRRSMSSAMGGFQLPRGGFNPQLNQPGAGGPMNFTQALGLPPQMPQMPTQPRMPGFGGMLGPFGGGGRMY